MEKKRKNRAHRSRHADPRPKKKRRRTRRVPGHRRRFLGHLAGHGFSVAARHWRPKGPVTEGLVDLPMDDTNKRVVKRLGQRIYGALSIEESLLKKQWARRRRRRHAVLAQEGRRRGLFRMHAKSFRI